MARNSFKDLTAAIRAPFLGRFGLLKDKSSLDWAYDNNHPVKWSNSADTADIEGVKVGADDKLYLGGQYIQPMYIPLQFALATNASLVSQVFFACPWATGCKVEKIQLKYATADGAANTAQVVKMADGVALASGTALQTDSFDLNGATDTVVEATLSTTAGVTTLNYKDRLGIKIASAVTSLAGLVVTVWVSGAAGNIVTFAMNANGDIGDQAFFVANRPMTVVGAVYTHTTKGTDASAVNVQLVKDTGTNAPGAGSDLLANNTNAGFDCKGTVNTAQVGSFKTTAGLLRLSPGDRLSVDFAGTPTALAGVVVTVLFAPTPGRLEVTYNLAKNANLVDQSFFVADRAYEVVAASAVWSTAADSGNVQLVKDKTTDAPGAGTDLLSNDSNAGFQIDQTANTVEVATFKDTRENIMLAGDRLSLDYSATTSLVGVVVTVSLKAA